MMEPLPNGTYEIAIQRRYSVANFSDHIGELSFHCHLVVLMTTWKMGLKYKLFGDVGCLQAPPNVNNGVYTLLFQNAFCLPLKACLILQKLCLIFLCVSHTTSSAPLSQACPTLFLVSLNILITQCLLCSLTQALISFEVSEHVGKLQRRIPVSPTCVILVSSWLVPRCWFVEMALGHQIQSISCRSQCPSSAPSNCACLIALSVSILIILIIQSLIFVSFIVEGNFSYARLSVGSKSMLVVLLCLSFLLTFHHRHLL